MDEHYSPYPDLSPGSPTQPRKVGYPMPANMPYPIALPAPGTASTTPPPPGTASTTPPPALAPGPASPGPQQPTTIQDRPTPWQPASSTQHAHRLLYHIAHLTNALTSQLSAYLSLEALHHDTLRSPIATPRPYDEAAKALGAILANLHLNLCAAHQALARTPEAQILGLFEGKGFRSLLDASQGLTAVMDLVGKEDKTDEEVRKLRKAVDELMELCYGSAEKGITGWKEVWNEVVLGMED